MLNEVVNPNETINKSIVKICQKMQERSVVLFLGAGVNANIVNDKGIQFPLGNSLSTWICRDLLEEIDSSRSLMEASEYAIQKWGQKAFNDYIYKKFNSFEPGDIHKQITQLPWQSIYTTNFDNLIEKSMGNSNNDQKFKITPVYSQNVDISETMESEILYYKLHGCIENSNDNGKLILTSEDYREYETYRRPLFSRLRKDIKNYTFVFIGYSMTDNNFKAILDDCRNTLGIKTFPLSYAIRPDFNVNDEDFWKDKYNVQLINCSANSYMDLLSDTWNSNEYAVIPFEKRRPKILDKCDNFPLIGESFYQIRLQDCTSISEPKEFFNGQEPSWGDIKDKYIPKRDLQDTILESILEDIITPNKKPNTYLISGSAGTGKTTIIKSLVFEIIESLDTLVFYHIPNTPLCVDELLPYFDENNKKRIILVIGNPSSNIKNINNFLMSVKKHNLPLSIIMEDRLNQWNYIKNNQANKIEPIQFILEKLSNTEIENILSELRKQNLLGKLQGCSAEQQTEHFRSLADKDLLVALKMLVNCGSFDEIIMDEFKRIPEEKAQKAYLYVSAFSQFDLFIRFETLVKLLDFDYSEVSEKLYLPTKGILFTEETGSSTSNHGFRFRARHPQIATTVYSEIANTDDKKFDIINEILNVLDPGYREDNFLIHKIIKSKNLIKTFESADMKRAIYEKLENFLPNNPYVYQHRAMLERDLGDFENAIHFAKMAVDIEPNNPSLLNTLGLAFDSAAWGASSNPMLTKTYLDEAEKLFKRCLKINPESPYDYYGLILVSRRRIALEIDEEEIKNKKINLISLIDEAYEKTQESEVIAKEKSTQFNDLGDETSALAILKASISKNPTNYRLRLALIDIEKKFVGMDQAFTTAMEGEKQNPNSWQIQREIARIKRAQKHSAESIKNYYNNATKLNQGNVPLLIESAAFLYMNGYLDESNTIFNKVKSLPIDSEIKIKHRQWVTDDDNNRIIFEGKVTDVCGAHVKVKSIPDNIAFSFFKNRTFLNNYKVKDNIRFYACFNAHGPKAYVIED